MLSHCRMQLGSSPPVRGIRRYIGESRRLTRIIPACAGNTTSLKLNCPIFKDHPRLCGEYFAQIQLHCSYTGSSPPVRGILRKNAVMGYEVGIIPACAGNTAKVQRSGVLRQDHPRLCGEYHHSSPMGEKERDHPRLCGEYFFRSFFFKIGRGSSPPVRGILRSLHSETLLFRIIPACAGNTVQHIDIVRIVEGSSPPVRGIHNIAPPSIESTRIIPACAGNTEATVFRILCVRDHPRLCGEYTKYRP